MTTEERILDAAEEEFLKKGFAGARTTAIAERAGVTHAMLHYYYRTKEKLFDRVVADKLSGLIRMMNISINDDKSLEDCLRAAVGNHFDFVSKNPLLPRFLVTEVFGNPTLLQLVKNKIGATVAEMIAKLQAKIDHGAERGTCRQISAQSLMLDILSLNVFPILAMPMVREMTTITAEKGFLATRREENIQTIIAKLK